MPHWFCWVFTLSLHCDISVRGWWRRVDAATTVTVDQDWVWLNINWLWVGGGLFPLGWQ